MRVGLLGGSFDPVHFGHLRAAECALEAFDLDRVRLMPARRSPFKDACVASEADRLAMLQLAIQDNPRLGVEACEFDREPPSYTVDTLRALTAKEPETRFALILGSDAAAELDGWREADEVRRLAEVLVLARPGEPSGKHAVVFGGLEISSTLVRAALKAGRSIRYLTPDAVCRYIADGGLYQ